MTLRLRLWVAAGHPHSEAALHNLRVFLEANGLRPELEVVDVFAAPERAYRDHVLVTPTLLRLGPPPTRRVLGSLEDGAALRGILDDGGPRRPERS